jgi:hypothetical protein
MRHRLVKVLLGGILEPLLVGGLGEAHCRVVDVVLERLEIICG